MKKEITLANREKILQLENFLLDNADGENIQGTGKEVLHSGDFPLKHTFVDGVYVREMRFKKDSAVVGAIHKHLHVWFLLYGHLFIATEDFINVHANPENITDIEELEKRLVSLNYEDYEQYIKNK